MDNQNSAGQIWDAVSASYQARRGLSTRTFSPGALVEDSLGVDLLGNVRGKRVLDAGCGGGQNCIALAHCGAVVTGFDASAAQIAHARALAAAEGIEIPFAVGDVLEQAAYAGGEYDILLSIAVLHYLPEPAPALQQMADALRPGGMLVVSVDHPVRSIFYDAEEEAWEVFPVQGYIPAAAAARNTNWRYPDTEIALTTWHHTVAEWVAMVAGAGLQLSALLEPPVPAALLDDLWPLDDALAPLRCIPHTLILVAHKPRD